MQASVLAQGVEFSSSEYSVVIGVAVIAVIALVVGFVLRQSGARRRRGHAEHADIGRAVQEGAQAFLNRQFKTLAPFIVVVFLVLFALPATSTGERIGRSIAFLFGAAVLRWPSATWA